MFKQLITYSITIFLVSCSQDIQFDSEKWKNAPPKGPDMSIRWDMSSDLLENYDLKGMDTTQIFQLLGRQNYDCYNNECIVRYTLGPCHRGIDYGTLELTFRDGVVVDIFKHCN